MGQASHITREWRPRLPRNKQSILDLHCSLIPVVYLLPGPRMEGDMRFTSALDIPIPLFDPRSPRMKPKVRLPSSRLHGEKYPWLLHENFVSDKESCFDVELVHSAKVLLAGGQGNMGKSNWHVL